MKKRFSILLGAAWLLLCAAAWLHPARDMSDAERRKLAQFPEVSASSVFSGQFMQKFETYSQDQFPLRDSFRQLKALVHYYAAGQKDNNGIYLVHDSAVKLDYPLDEDSVDYALGRFRYLYNTYLKDTGSSVYAAVVPDKGYYLAGYAGAPRMDYDALFEKMEAGMPWAAFADLTGSLSENCYYRTDIHWRQEKLGDAAAELCRAMEIPEPGQLLPKPLEVPFYGVYYGQAALPMRPETMYVMESDLLDACTVYNYETGGNSWVYDMTKLESKDLYDVFLSGSVSLLRIDNPNADTDRELIIFRDSFGSSLAPYLVQGYRSVTLVDIRYLSSQMLDRFLTFSGQDVLFLYSTPVLNSSNTLK